MEGNYAVSFGNELCGKVQVIRQGLYYRFICRCQLSGDVVCRLCISCGGRQEDLGILVPMDGGFGTDRKLPVKRLGEGRPEFHLHTKQLQAEESFIPIIPEEPFGYISRLKEAYLVKRNGQAGILLK